MKKDKLGSRVEQWIHLETITLREVKQAQELKHNMVSLLMGNPKHKQTAK